MPLDLTGLTPQERSRAKSVAIHSALAAINFPITFTASGVTITVSGAWVEGDMIGVSLTATKDSAALPTDDAYYFYNPPIRVPDGLGGFVESYVAAAKAILVEAVLAYARSQGSSV